MKRRKEAGQAEAGYGGRRCGANNSVSERPAVRDELVLYYFVRVDVKVFNANFVQREQECIAGPPMPISNSTSIQLHSSP